MKLKRHNKRDPVYQIAHFSVKHFPQFIIVTNSLSFQDVEQGSIWTDGGALIVTSVNSSTKTSTLIQSVQAVQVKNTFQRWSNSKFTFTVRVSVRLSDRSKVTQNKINFVKNCPKWGLNPLFQVMWYYSLVVARHNVPITSFLTYFALGSWKDFDLSLIGSNEKIWKTFFVIV